MLMMLVVVRGKANCEGKADDGDGDNDKTDCDDNADGGGGNSNDDGYGNGIFENWCVDGEGDDEADDGDEQTESVSGVLAECSGSCKMEMSVGVMRWRILKEAQGRLEKVKICFRSSELEQKTHPGGREIIFLVKKYNFPLP